MPDDSPFEPRLRFPIAHPSHRFSDGDWNDFYCVACGLSQGYTAVERPCPGVHVFACGNVGYWRAEEGGECTQVFQSRRDARDHWFRVHAASSVNESSGPT